MRLRSSYVINVSIFIFCFHFSRAQPGFEFEVKVGSFKTENSGQLIGGGGGLQYYFITKEDDPISWCYSIGLVCKLNERHLLKLHVGKHRNGRIFDATLYDDVFGGPDNIYTALDMPYYYLQIAPSYSYRILNKKVIIPIEIGININKNINEDYVFLVGLNKYNFDYEISSGLQYKIIDQIILGVHGVFTDNLTEYQDKETVYGTFKPLMFGIEFSASYVFNKKVVSE